MARIVNVIESPHLVTYKGYEDSEYVCCGVCQYKVFIETDEGSLLAASVLDDSDLHEFDVDKATEELLKDSHDSDFFYTFNKCVGVDDFSSFVNGMVETGYNATEALTSVIHDIIEGHALVSRELREVMATLSVDAKRLSECKR